MIFQAIESYKEGLKLLGSRSVDPIIWNALHWELSETIFSKATKYQNKLNILSVSNSIYIQQFGSQCSHKMEYN